MFTFVLNKRHKKMKKEEILKLFKSLAMSQGFYGRLLERINEDKEWGNVFLAELEKQNFKDSVDLILAIEG